MNREAAALGIPAYTPFAARMGAVDTELISAGRLRRLAHPDDLVLERRRSAERPALRDPEFLLDLILKSHMSKLGRS